MFRYLVVSSIGAMFVLAHQDKVAGWFAVGTIASIVLSFPLIESIAFVE